MGDPFGIPQFGNTSGNVVVGNGAGAVSDGGTALSSLVTTGALTTALGSYALSSALASYLPLTGGTVASLEVGNGTGSQPLDVSAVGGSAGWHPIAQFRSSATNAVCAYAETGSGYYVGLQGQAQNNPGVTYGLQLQPFGGATYTTHNTLDNGGGDASVAGLMQAAAIKATGVMTLGTVTSGTLPSETDADLIYVSDLPAVAVGIGGNFATLPYVASGALGTVYTSNALTVPGLYPGYTAPPTDTTTPVTWMTLIDSNGTVYKIGLFQ